MSRFSASIAAVTNLPAPRIRQQNMAVTASSTDRFGNPVDGFGVLRVSIDGLPEELRLNPDLRCQIELGRYIGKRKKLSSNSGYIQIGQGFYHPSPWVGGVTPLGSGGTRGGRQNLPAAVDRPTEWPVLGLGVGGSVNLPVASTFAPWCQQFKVKDLNGNAVNTVTFRTKISRRNKRPPGYYPNTLTGVFAFRFAFFDVIGKRWVSGPWSEPVFVKPKGWPLATQPVGPYPALTTTLPDRPTFVQIAASVGGRIR